MLLAVDTSRDTQSRQKAKALYQFDARNHDELSLIPGDIVLVSTVTTQNFLILMQILYNL